jgi:acetyltransferase-like isoleucine patch superfamily enzyme
VQVREGVRVGSNCIVGKGVYIDFDVVIGDNVKIQNGCYIYHGVTLEDGVFVGPGVILTNDKHPRAINADGSLKTDSDWVVGKILVKRGAALGARTVVLPDVTVGTFAMIGAGSVVTRDVPDYGLAWGNPARLRGFVCPCGHQLETRHQPAGGLNGVQMACPVCQIEIDIPMETYLQIKEV